MMKIKKPEEIIIKVLRIGVIISATLIIIGLMLLYFNGSESTYGNNSFINILNGVKVLNPYSIIMLGLLILIITPVLRVIASIFVFYIEKDFLYVKITIIVLIILSISFLIGIYFSN